MIGPTPTGRLVRSSSCAGPRTRSSVSERAPVDVNRAIEDTLLFAHGQIAKAGVAIRTALTPDLGPVSGDGNALSQVILNLLTNARDAMPAGGEITIETAPAPDAPHCILVRVTDTGQGMDTDTLARIFDPFYTTKSTGTGLGLSIAYGIVRDHGGTIAVESSPGAGTAFLIRLPTIPASGAR